MCWWAFIVKVARKYSFVYKYKCVSFILINCIIIFLCTLYMFYSYNCTHTQPGCVIHYKEKIWHLLISHSINNTIKSLNVTMWKIQIKSWLSIYYLKKRYKTSNQQVTKFFFIHFFIFWYKYLFIYFLFCILN